MGGNYVLKHSINNEGSRVIEIDHIGKCPVYYGRECTHFSNFGLAGEDCPEHYQYFTSGGACFCSFRLSKLTMKDEMRALIKNTRKKLYRQGG